MSVNVVFASKFDKSGLTSAQKEIGKFTSTIKGVLGGFGAVSLLSGLSQQFEQLSKAAIDDVKSQKLLALALRNSVGASDDVTKSVEDQIGKWELQTGILDDKIRPAYAAAARATGDVSKANKLMSVALDVSAGTGKDLEIVVKSISRALDGNAAGLQRLVPGIKVTDDVLGSLSAQFTGAAAAANETDPYQRMNTIINALSEQIGMALLPALERTADWFASPEVQGSIQYLIGQFTDFTTEMYNAATGTNVLLTELTSLLSLDPSTAQNAWDGFFKGLGTSIKTLVLGNRYFSFLYDVLSRFGAKVAAIPKATGASVMDNYRLDQIKTPKVKAYTPPAGKKPATSAKTAKDDFAAKKLAAEQKAAAEAAKAAAELAARIKELKDEFKKAIQGSFKELLAKEIPAMGMYEQKVADTFTAIKETILNADDLVMNKKKRAIFAGLAEFAQQQLQKIAKQRDELATKIENTKSFMESVRDSIFGQVNITDMGKSAKAIIGNFQKIIKRTLDFKKNIAALQAQGLGQDALKQIIEAGAETGGTTASALLRGGDAAISEVNSLFGQLTSAAAGVSETAGQALYGSGVDLSNGLIAGLLSQEEQLKMAAETLATAFQSTFNQRLGLGKADISGINVAGTTKAGTTINLTVNAPMGTGNNIGKLIIDEISRFERTSGIVFARA